MKFLCHLWFAGCHCISVTLADDVTADHAQITLEVSGLVPGSKLVYGLLRLLKSISSATQAQVDGVQLQEARLQEEVPLALLEDELDAAGHPWNSPSLGRFVDTVGAGRGALCSTPAAQCSSRRSPGSTAFSPMDMVLQSQSQSQQRSQQRTLPNVLRGSTWGLVRGIERALAAVSSEGGGYSDLRSSLMMAMLQPPTASLQISRRY